MSADTINGPEFDMEVYQEKLNGLVHAWYEAMQRELDKSISFEQNVEGTSEERAQVVSAIVEALTATGDERVLKGMLDKATRDSGVKVKVKGERTLEGTILFIIEEAQKDALHKEIIMALTSRLRGDQEATTDAAPAKEATGDPVVPGRVAETLRADWSPEVTQQEGTA